MDEKKFECKMEMKCRYGNHFFVHLFEGITIDELGELLKDNFFQILSFEMKVIE